MKQALKETARPVLCFIAGCLIGVMAALAKHHEKVQEWHHNIHILKHELKQGELEIEVLKLKLELWRKERKLETNPEQEVFYFVPADLNQ